MRKTSTKSGSEVKRNIAFYKGSKKVYDANKGK